jgi:hypothetical protein
MSPVAIFQLLITPRIHPTQPIDMQLLSHIGTAPRFHTVFVAEHHQAQPSGDLHGWIICRAQSLFRCFDTIAAGSEIEKAKMPLANARLLEDFIHRGVNDLEAFNI